MNAIQLSFGMDNDSEFPRIDVCSMASPSATYPYLFKTIRDRFIDRMRIVSSYNGSRDSAGRVQNDWFSCRRPICAETVEGNREGLVTAQEIPTYLHVLLEVDRHVTTKVSYIVR